jgi:YaiO family outer membrane protein
MCHAKGWLTGLDYAIVPGPGFLPRVTYSGYIGKALDRGWVVNLRYRLREYDTTTVGSTTGLVERYVGDLRLAYALNVSQLQGASHSVGHNFMTSWYYDERSSISLSLNKGKEAEAVAPGQVLESDVQGISIAGRQQITERFGLRWWLGLQDQGDFYRRYYFGMAVSVKL